MKKAQLFIVFAAFLLIVLGFQNCSAPLPEEEEGDYSSKGGDGGFAFSTRVDQVAYMSCPLLGTSYDKSSYFTFRVGAYEPGNGVGLNSTASEELASKPIDTWKSEIVDKKANLGAMPVLAIRNRASVQDVLRYSSASVREVNHLEMLGVLSDDYLIDEILKNTSQKVRYKRNGFPLGARAEGHLNLATDFDKLTDVQLKLKNGWLLAVNYPIKTTAVQQVRAPAHYSSDLDPSTASTQVYGNGLRLDFKNMHPQANLATTWALNVIGEENMELPLGASGRVQSGNFNCPSSLIFKVVHRRDLTTATTEDTSKINCAQKADNPNSLTQADRELLRRARLSLRIEDWWIDWQKKCIVPKKFGTSIPHCYGSSPNLIEYDLSKTCHPNPVAGSTLKRCVALASICIR